jgi:flagellum-specific ATP synthase
LGHPLDQLEAPACEAKLSLNGTSINPFKRNPINEVLDVGIRNINANLTIGRGQRIGIVAGSGVGKSVLLSMISKSTDADIVVIALIGERGRELASFTSKVLASHSLLPFQQIVLPYLEFREQNGRLQLLSISEIKAKMYC